MGVLLALAVCCASAQARGPALTPAADFAADARLAAAQRVPIIVLFSLAGCPYCDEIRRSHLVPLTQAAPSRAMVRQVELRGDDTLIDFAGRRTTHRAFAQAAKVNFAPVVMFFGARGERLGEALVGAMIPDFYGLYLEEALAQATAVMRAAGQESGARAGR